MYSLEEAKKNLERASQNLASIGDAREYKANNHQDFLQKVQQVVAWYKYIQNNYQDNRVEIIDAIAIVLEIGEENPGLKAVCDSIISAKNDKPVVAAQEESKMNEVDPSGLSNRIVAIVGELRNQNGYDTETIGDFEWAMEECVKDLISQRTRFSPEEYEYLMSLLQTELGKIKKFNEFLEDDSKSY